MNLEYCDYLFSLSFLYCCCHCRYRYDAYEQCQLEQLCRNSDVHWLAHTYTIKLEMKWEVVCHWWWRSFVATLEFIADTFLDFTAFEVVSRLECIVAIWFQSHRSICFHSFEGMTNIKKSIGHPPKGLGLLKWLNLRIYKLIVNG